MYEANNKSKKTDQEIVTIESYYKEFFITINEKK